MKGKIVLVGALVVLALAGYVVWNQVRRILVQDTLHAVASSAAKFQDAHPRASEAEMHEAVGKELLRLANASVTDAWFDEAGRPVDPWGSPFVIDVDVAAGGKVIGATSLGPDRRAGTWDDVVVVDGVLVLRESVR